MKAILLILAVTAAIEARSLNVENTLGSYNLNYRTDTAARNEARDQDGNTVGSYSFIDDQGFTHVVKYRAGEDIGFQVVEISDPIHRDINEARADHLKQGRSLFTVFPTVHDNSVHVYRSSAPFKHSFEYV